MNPKGELLDILFRRIAPERLLNRIQNSPFPPFDETYQKWFLSVAEESLRGYSGDEKLLWYQMTNPDGAEAQIGFRDSNDRVASKKGVPPFHCLTDYGDDTLIRRGERVFCKFSCLLDWRNTYLHLGQDLLVTSWLAFVLPGEPGSYAWPGVIPTDNKNLSYILRSGIAENHYHLYGSSEIFALNWCRLMNYPCLDEDGEKWFRNVENNLQAHISRGVEGNRWPMRKRVLYAAVLRALLFVRLREADFDCLSELRKFDKSISEYESRQERWFQQEDAHSRWLTARERERNAETAHECQSRKLYAFLSERADELIRKRLVPYAQEIFLFEQPRGGNVETPRQRLDYAFTRNLKNDSNRHNRVLCGERKLLFECFQQCFGDGFDTDTQWLFYLYLLLKSAFREELVQANHETGFLNFQNYQDRKSGLLKPSKHPDRNGDIWCQYADEAIRTAVNEPLYSQPISSLELRISPKQDAQGMLEFICDMDRVCTFHWYPEKDETKQSLAVKLPDSKARTSWYSKFNPNGPFMPMDIPPNLAPENKGHFFYVLHFIKEQERPLSTERDVSCRHHALRKKHLQQAIAVKEALDKAPWLARRIRGIDAASNEIGCRPEVYAVPFRFLQNIPSEILYATCHVGEDFLDLADGLRAVDEAICFLNLPRGSRLGHALALGVNPATHYSLKHHCVILPKQDLLDNLVWLYYRGIELNVEFTSNLKDSIRNQADDLLSKLYRNLSGSETATLRDYYHSWLLRGDNPYWYRETGQCLEPEPGFGNLPYHDEFRNFALNRFKERRNDLEKSRKNNVVLRLLHNYHFSKIARQEGAKPTQFQVTFEYTQLIAQIQQKMRNYVMRLGLGIECNPSSNTLIGSFQEYGFHPVFQFNNFGLRHAGEPIQLHVSLNTDDQGVFHTNLVQEYALIASALAEQRDDDGLPKYHDREIEEYIRRLQQMGLEQSFY